MRADTFDHLAVRAGAASIGGHNFSYGAFGEGEGADGIGFQGRWGGLSFERLEGVLLWHRWVMPQQNVWKTRDPLGLLGGVNAFQFCRNNPLSYVDPTGLRDCTLTMLLIKMDKKGRAMLSNIQCIAKRLAGDKIKASEIPKATCAVIDRVQSGDPDRYYKADAVNPPVALENGKVAASKESWEFIREILTRTVDGEDAKTTDLANRMVQAFDDAMKRGDLICDNCNVDAPRSGSGGTYR